MVAVGPRRGRRIHRNTVSNFETGKYAGTQEAIEAMRRALEAAGVIFLDNGEGPGVKLRKGAPPKPTVSKG